MNQAGNEGIDIMKMAVSVLLATLLVSAAAILFYRIYAWVNADTTGVKNTLVEAQMDKYFELEDMSSSAYAGTGNYPLVTVVASVMLEGASQDILFYEIFDENGNVLAAFSSADLTGIVVNGAIVVENPEDATASLLMKYAGHRCSVTVEGDGDTDTGLTAGNSTNAYPAGMYAILIRILP